MAQPTTETFTNVGVTTWQVPAGVTEIQIEAIGGGGAGGYVYSLSPGGDYGISAPMYRVSGGGSGACYARKTLTVTPGEVFYIHVGKGGRNKINSTGGYYTESWVAVEINKDGEASYVENSSNNVVVRANGGISVRNHNNLAGAAAPSSTGCVGDFVSIGGKGGNAEREALNCWVTYWSISCRCYKKTWPNTYMYGRFSSGGGGGAGHATGNGGNGGNAKCDDNEGYGRGGESYAPSGNGGTGTSDYNNVFGGQGIGNPGVNYGGGGAGSKCGGDGTMPHSGGEGAQGVVIIKYTKPICASYPSVNSITTSSTCPGFPTYTLTADITSVAGIATYNWTGVTSYAENVGTINATLPNCNHKYDYSLQVVDNNGCASEVKTGSFTTTAPALTANASTPQPASGTTGDLHVPDLTNYLKSLITSGCNNVLTIVGSDPALNSSLTGAGPTNVDYTVEDMCGNRITIPVQINHSIGPDPDPSGGDEFYVTLTAANTRLCAGDVTQLVAKAHNATAAVSYTWSSTELQDGGVDYVKITPTTLTAGTDVTYTVTGTSNGVSKEASVTIHVNPVATISNVDAGSFCMPAHYEYTPSAPANTQYTWTVKSNEDNAILNAKAETTPQNKFNVINLLNNATASKTVVYEVTPITTTGGVGCPGQPFEISITVKPSILNDPNLVFTVPGDITKTLYYGVCDTLITIDPADVVATTSIAEYAGNLTVTATPGEINDDGKLEVSLPEGEYSILWTVTDPCGNSVSDVQKVTINYPACTGTVDDANGNTYQVVRVGCECWTKTNLKATKYVGGGDVSFANGYNSVDYPNTDQNIDKFGRLYTWYSALNVAEGDNSAVPTVITDPTSHLEYVQGICPQGWAIPTSASFESVKILAGSTEGMRTTDASMWLPGGAGTDVTGFSAVGAGYYDSNVDRYVNLLGETYWWESDYSTSIMGKCSSITHTCPHLILTEQNKGFGLSVRCVKRAND